MKMDAKILQMYSLLGRIYCREGARKVVYVMENLAFRLRLS